LIAQQKSKLRQIWQIISGSHRAGVPLISLIDGIYEVIVTENGLHEMKISLNQVFVIQAFL
jgi:hypothetical protein